MRVVVADFSGVAQGLTFGRFSARCSCGARPRRRSGRPWSAGSPPGGFSIPTKRQPTARSGTALRFAWRICAHVKSNTTVFTGRPRTLAIGAGQMSRVDAANVAVMKAKQRSVSLAGSACASDAFFPFRDGLDVVAPAREGQDLNPAGRCEGRRSGFAGRRRARIAMVFAGCHFRHRRGRLLLSRLVVAELRRLAAAAPARSWVFGADDWKLARCGHRSPRQSSPELRPGAHGA